MDKRKYFLIKEKNRKTILEQQKQTQELRLMRFNGNAMQITIVL